MNKLALSLAGLITFAGVATAQQPSGDFQTIPDGTKVQYLGVLNAATGQIGQPGVRGTLGDPVYLNNAVLRNTFYSALADGRTIIDEGRIPSTSSTDVAGTQDSYAISSLQINYFTNATDSTLGGVPLELEVKLYESYTGCASPLDSDAPIATITVPNLPASTTGGLAGYTLDVDVSMMSICMRGDGDGVYSDGFGDRFGISYQFTERGDATALGPRIVGDPLNVPAGDGTAFQNSAATVGSGLTTGDFFRSIMLDGTENCFFFGGYDPDAVDMMGNPDPVALASFWTVIRSDLLGDCYGCGIGDDRFEDNDVAADAAPITYGTTTQLLMEEADALDWYTFDVPAGTSVTVEMFFTDADLDLDLRLEDSTGGFLASSGSVSDNESLTWDNICGTTAETVFLRVNEFGGAETCEEYVLSITGAPGPPVLPDDMLEDNDDIASAVPLPLGLTRDLVVFLDPCVSTTDDEDFYSITLGDMETLTVDLLFIDDEGDIDGRITDLTGTTLGNTGGSISDNENFSYTNMTGADQDVVVRVFRWGTQSSTRYDMVANVTAAPTFGELICVGNPNSVGDGSRVMTSGSDVAADNALTLSYTGLPDNALCLVVCSQDTVVVTPPGSEGNLCIAALSIARFTSLAGMSSVGGEYSITPDLTSIPFFDAMGLNLTAVMATDTFNFQLWHRDTDAMMMLTSNFSDAIAIEFQ